MKERLIMTLLFLFAMALYVLTVRGIYGNPTGRMVKNNLDQASKPFELSPERGRYLLTLSLAENKSFALSKELADAADPDVGYYQGRFYVYFAPGISILALPMYYLGRQFNLAQVASYLTISIFAAITLLFIYKVSRNIFKLPIWASVFAPLIFAFGSTSWSYATTMYQHHVTTFCIISSFYAVWKYKQKGKWSFLWALLIWFNYALAIGIDYPNFVFMLPVMVYFFVSSIRVHTKGTKTSLSLRISFALTSIVFIVICLAHAYYNTVNFGGPTKLSSSIVGYPKVRELNLTGDPNAEKKLAILEKNKVPIKFFKEDNFPRGVTILLVAIDKGIFLFSPIFLLSLLGIGMYLSSISLEIGVLFAGIIINIFLYASFGDPWGGWAFGPRYLIPSMAPLSIFIASWMARTRYQIIGRIVAFILFAFSLGVSLLGVLTTNAVPPKIEADYLKMKYNFLLNWDFLIDNRSSSFIYNTFFAHKLSLIQYFIFIYFAVITVVYIVLFVVPLIKYFNKK